MNTRIPLLIGQSDFAQFRRAGAYYVDKSGFIQEVIESAMQVLLLPRSRRFGKPLNLSMVRYFFEKNEQHHADLSKGLAIRDTPVFEQYHGKYPAIYLSFKDQKALSWNDVFQSLTNLIQDEFVYLVPGCCLPGERIVVDARAKMC